MAVLLKGGMVFKDRGFVKTDMLMADGVIAAVGEGLRIEGVQSVDATGKRIVPGFLDIHTHGAVAVSYTHLTLPTTSRV